MSNPTRPQHDARPLPPRGLTFADLRDGERFRIPGSPRIWRRINSRPDLTDSVGAEFPIAICEQGTRIFRDDAVVERVSRRASFRITVGEREVTEVALARRKEVAR